MDTLGEQIAKLMRESKRKDNEIERLIYQVADYLYQSEVSRPQIDENAMALLDELAETGYRSEVRGAIGVYTNE